MTEEEKELLLKDLCARFAYDLKVSEYFEETKIWANPRDFEDVGPYYILKHPEKIKPYLRPLSSMTEEEKTEFMKFITWTFDCVYDYQPNTLKGVLNGNEIETDLIVELFDWLNKNMFDYRGLIPMGLALEAPEGMYK